MGTQNVAKFVLKEDSVVLFLILRNEEFLDVDAAFGCLCDDQKDFFLSWMTCLRDRGRLLQQNLVGCGLWALFDLFAL